MKQYVITRINNIYTGFLFEDGHAKEIRPYENNSVLGNIYVGRVSNIVPNINAAFVDIGRDISCYLSMEDYGGEKPLKCGDLITVQVIKDKVKTKQATVSANISISGDYVMIQRDYLIGASSRIQDKAKRSALKKLLGDTLTCFEGQKKCADISYGGIIRTKAGQADAEAIEAETVKLLCKLDGILYRARHARAYSCLYQSDLEYVRDIRGFLREGVGVITDCKDIYDKCFDEDNEISLYTDESPSLDTRYRLEKLLRQCMSKCVYLKSGAYLVIEPTEALTVIDVNSGKAVRGSDAEEIRLKLNIEAAKEAARQLRLRNISGIVIIDFISMKSRANQNELTDKLREFTSDDSIHTDVIGITKLGLVELTRKKVKKPIYEVFNK